MDAAPRPNAVAGGAITLLVVRRRCRVRDRERRSVARERVAAVAAWVTRRATGVTGGAPPPSSKKPPPAEMSGSDTIIAPATTLRARTTLSSKALHPCPCTSSAAILVSPIARAKALSSLQYDGLNQTKAVWVLHPRSAASEQRRSPKQRARQRRTMPSRREHSHSLLQ